MATTAIPDASSSHIVDDAMAGRGGNGIDIPGWEVGEAWWGGWDDAIAMTGGCGECGRVPCLTDANRGRFIPPSSQKFAIARLWDKQ